MLLTQQPCVQFLGIEKIYFDIVEIYRRVWLKESGQRLENVDQTYLELASGKLVLQKMTLQSNFTLLSANQMPLFGEEPIRLLCSCAN